MVDIISYLTFGLKRISLSGVEPVYEQLLVRGVTFVAVSRRLQTSGLKEQLQRHAILLGIWTLQQALHAHANVQQRFLGPLSLMLGPVCDCGTGGGTELEKEGAAGGAWRRTHTSSEQATKPISAFSKSQVSVMPCA